jgi:hypothetical protein
MINHISIGVRDPQKVAGVLAELWEGYAFPFPPSPDSYFVLANDGKGTLVEVTPINTVMVPGEGFPPEENFDAATPTEQYEAKFVRSDFSPQYVATHLALNTRLTEAEVKAIANREGWRTITANRGGGLFQLIEVWVENRFLLEVFTTEMTFRYIEVFNAQFIAEAMQIPLPPKYETAPDLSLIG